MLKPLLVLDESSLEGLLLISKSQNKPYHPVYREELPPVLYGHSPRQLLGYSWFSKYTEGLNSIKVCQGCGTKLFSGGEKHETYGLYQFKLNGVYEYIIKLEDVIKLCSKCHRTIHSGFSTRLGMKYGSLPQVAPESLALKTGPWSKAKYLLVDKNLYLL